MFGRTWRLGSWVVSLYANYDRVCWQLGGSLGGWRKPCGNVAYLWAQVGPLHAALDLSKR